MAVHNLSLMQQLLELFQAFIDEKASLIAIIDFFILICVVNNPVRLCGNLTNPCFMSLKRSEESKILRFARDDNLDRLQYRDFSHSLPSPCQF